MNMLQDSNFKLKYQKCKYRVKVWESEFKKKNGHDPTKDDIREAPSRVREAYKKYYNMKTKMLEELDILLCEDTISSPIDKNEELKFDSISKEPEKCAEDKIDLQRIVLADIQNCPEATDINTTLSKKVVAKEDGDHKSLTDNVWGDHLNVNKSIESKTRSLNRSFSSTFAEKLAKGAQFCKRNPRKSLSSRSSKNCKPGLFNTLSQEIGPDDFSRSSIGFSQDNSCETISVSCSLPSQSTENASDNKTSNFMSEFQKFKFSSQKLPTVNQPISIIQKAVNSTNIEIKKRNVDKDWLDRCSSEHFVEDKLPCINDNAVDTPWEAGVQEEEIGTSFQTFSRNNLQGCDDIGSDEEVIYSSGDESSQSRLTLKRKSSVLSCGAELLNGNIAKRQKNCEIVDDDFVSSTPKTSFSSSNILRCSETQEVSQLEGTFKMSTVPNNLQTISQAAIDEIADQIVENKSANTDVSGQNLSKKILEKRIKAVGEKLSKKEVLEKKVANGQLNDNFVRVNLKKKVYVRGKKTMTYAKHKKMQWKANKKSAALGDDTDRQYGVLKCFKCGDVGHYARNCHKDNGDKLLSLSDNEDDSEYPTLEEAAAMAASCKLPSRRISPRLAEGAKEGESRGCKIPQYVVDALREQDEKKHVSPVYSLGCDGCPISPTEEVYSALREFGHTEFREGQSQAIMRILSGLSTLVTLSTGAGKSLCYQLPALIYSRHSKCITLVVSPLVSLMEDQVAGLPNCIKVACLHHNQSEKQRSEILEQAKSGELDALLVSPEAVMSGEKSRNFGSIVQDLPPIAFACIDEAHCLSQWSDNFRPSYLMISEVLRTKLGVRTFLGLTATATSGTCTSILQHLGICDEEKGVIKDTPLPDNLILTVSRDRRRDDALLAMLAGSRFSSCDSIIVYCIRRAECERIAVLIRTCLQEGKRPEENKIRCRVSTNAEAYHAGLTPARRKMVQRNFMSGKLRIVVATVAFGMGIDKKDIRAVIHYNMPKNFESYVQEVGRAGRDGLPAHCHLFLDSDGGDLSELRRHIYGNSIDRHVMRKLLQRVFVPCRCNRLKKLVESSYAENGEADKVSETNSVTSSVKCPGHEIAFKISETVQALDIPEENIATMLCYLELHPKKWIKVLSPAYTMCKVQSYGGTKALKVAAKNSPPLAMAIALDQRRGISHDNSNSIEFPVVDVAAALNWDSGFVKSNLKSLEWSELTGKWKRTRISVELSELGFRVHAPGMLPADELDEALDVLHERVDNQERACLLQLQYAFEAFTSVAHSSCLECSESVDESHSNTLKKLIREYFQLEHLNAELKMKEKLSHEDQVIADTRQLVCSYPDTTFTGRAVARIFHGIESPCFPARTWGRCRFWRAHLNEDFKLLVKVTTREIISLR